MCVYTYTCHTHLNMSRISTHLHSYTIHHIIHHTPYTTSYTMHHIIHHTPHHAPYTTSHTSTLITHIYIPHTTYLYTTHHDHTHTLTHNIHHTPHYTPIHHTQHTHMPHTIHNTPIHHTPCTIHEHTHLGVSGSALPSTETVSSLDMAEAYICSVMCILHM